MTKKSDAAPVQATPLVADLTALFDRRGQEGFTILSAVSGVSVSRLTELRDGAEPDLMERVTLQSLAMATF